ncbi:Predicted ATPase, AAA+ ATPase superfamily [Mitsuaria sp. PDC51]|uniref:AAA family ATPase n=1 Tax=Mitsuaria sp. PDC51 TaxID=1881035 RepID=UPI0008E583D5|nr:ATP-binding protein [Mitsuaria sp. PDC51]SFR77102.1 Predicted ATPase, AAA+ ATPase superfamily [Mitsuaria sp. PDC51]
MTIEETIAAFRSSVSPNLLAERDFIDWPAIELQQRNTANAVHEIQLLVNEGDLSRDRLAEFLRTKPLSYPLFLDLIAFNTSGSQVEKWGLPQFLSHGSNRADWVAGQLLHVGLGRILRTDTPVEALLRVAEVYKDSYKRRFRSAGEMETRTHRLVHAAVGAANASLQVKVSVNSAALVDAGLRRSLTHVLAVGNRPVAGVATVFQNQSGGRQQRDLAFTYPNLQERMTELGMALILLADGQGLKEVSDRTLSTLFEAVRYPMSLAQAESGSLAEAIKQAATVDAPRTVERVALDKIIEEGLRTRLEVRAEDLPVGPNQARLALASYAEGRHQIALELGDGAQSVSWGRRPWVERARTLKRNFSTGQAIALFAEMVGDPRSSIGLLDTTADLVAPQIQPFASRLHVASNSAPLTPERARTVAQQSIEQAPGSPVAIYLAPHQLDAEQLQAHRKSQIFLPTNVVVLSPDHLESMAERRRPILPLMDFVLTQSDLTKVSPYILNNATPARMFYGREREAATVLQTIATNSVAILGSRRIGKTSLIRRLQLELSNMRFQTYFGDCQTVRTWADFGDLARRKWGVDLQADFRPDHMADLVAKLGERGEGQVVIILDEIDQLLDWDSTPSNDSVPEGFFRACRSLSQEGAAHFVFSGERRIANRLWDPLSPHWNFCREVQLAQLDRSDALSLLIDPLRAMNIQIVDGSAFENEAWSRTSGHPQIVQYLGDRLIRSLDDRADRRNLTLSAEDVVDTTETFEFAEHYLTTYWGQATPFEKAVSRAVAAGATTSAEIIERLPGDETAWGENTLAGALRMLRLYGVVEERDGQLQMRASWFSQALSHYND